MTPKVAIACFAGIGGSAAVYGMYTYKHSADKGITNSQNFSVPPTINVVSNDITAPTTKSTAICTTPSKKATITDSEAEYYICESTTAPTGDTITTTDITATENVDADHIFKQTKYSIVTTPPTTSTQWTYTQKEKTPAIDFHWLRETDNKDIFFITKPADTTLLDLTTDNGVIELVSKIEKLRKVSIIAIVTTAASDAKTIDSISCTNPKRLTNNKTPDTEYYACASITGADNTAGDVPAAVAQQKTFHPNETYKTKTTTNHTITKWSKQDQTTHYFLWFKPTATNTEKTTFFLITSTNGNIDDDKAKEITTELETFKRLQK